MKEMNINKLEQALSETITGTPKATTVQGTTFVVYSDFIKRATMAYNTETEEIRPIRTSGYLSNDLAIRKAIAMVWRLKSFRK